MKIKIDTISKESNYAYGQDLVFLYFPQYVEGHIVWWEYAWKHYQYQYKGHLAFPRTKKVTLKYSLYIK